MVQGTSSEKVVENKGFVHGVVSKIYKDIKPWGGEPSLREVDK